MQEVWGSEAPTQGGTPNLKLGRYGPKMRYVKVFPNLVSSFTLIKGMKPFKSLFKRTSQNAPLEGSSNTFSPRYPSIDQKVSSNEQKSRDLTENYSLKLPCLIVGKNDSEELKAMARELNVSILEIEDLTTLWNVFGVLSTPVLFWDANITFCNELGCRLALESLREGRK
ncbi:MAG: hypothetical protein DRO00_01190 [Thermoproteota archaeon]|nr:MAG: hypothetical protein DRO00_01190 [Candidatus Korarchaeota archaeon]